MRKWLIGDIRGESILLLKLLDKIGPTSSDTVIFLGSYLGPGPSSQTVMDMALEMQQGKYPGTFLFLRGCYEYMFPKVIGEDVYYKDVDLWSQMGGMHVFESYSSGGRPLIFKQGSELMRADMDLKIPETHVRFLESLQQWFVDDELPFVACHCGTHPGIFGIPSDKSREEESVFSGAGWWEHKEIQVPGKDIIFSHVPFKKPLVVKGKIGIDLGAGMGGRLCAYEAYSQEFSIVG